VTLDTLVMLVFWTVTLLLVVVGAAAAYTYIERKVLGRIQQRLGPTETGPFGILQAIADAVKLLLKEDIRARGGDGLIYYLAPIALFVPSFLMWVTIPFTREIVLRNLEMGLFYITAVTVFSIVGMVLAGWASGSKYSVLGSARSAAQLISYELPIIFVIAGIGVVAQSFNLVKIVDAQATVPNFLIQPLGFAIFFIAALAEVGRVPFDIPQAESEVVGGPFVEYTGMRWAIFFLSEYANTFALAVLATLIFLGGWNGPLLPPLVWLLVKVMGVTLVIFWLRATLPRLRVDQLMSFAWKFLLPLAFLYLVLNAVALFYLKEGAAGAWMLGPAGQVVLAVAQWAALLGATYYILRRAENYRVRLRERVAVQ
jgi:NADH-quinone oxidoreductase subunit H